MPAVPAPELGRNRDFNVYWLGQTLSVLGDSFSNVATPLLVLQATGSVERMGQLTALIGLGFVLSGLFAGALVDRLDRRRLMIFCDLARLLVFSAVPLVWWLRGPSLPLLYVAGFLGALLGNTFQVACVTAVANLVGKSQVTEANGRLHATYAAMFCVGPMLAGMVCHRLGPSAAIGVDALTFGASALSLLFVKLRRDEAAPAAERKAPLEELLAGARYLFGTPVLRAVGLLLAATSLLQGARNDLLIFHVKQDLGLGDEAVGGLFGVASLGAIVAGLIASRLKRRFGFAVCWLGASFVLGGALAGCGLAGALPPLAALGMFMAFGDSIRGINSMSLRQEITPDHLLGRVTAAFWTLINLPMPLGAALTTAAAGKVGAGPTLLGVGLGTLGLSFAALFTAVRSYAPAPTPVEPDGPPSELRPAA